MSMIDLAVLGALWGALCGVGPLIYAVKQKKELLGVLSLMLCMVAGVAVGVFLAVPVAGIMFAVIASGAGDKS